MHQKTSPKHRKQDLTTDAILVIAGGLALLFAFAIAVFAATGWAFHCRPVTTLSIHMGAIPIVYIDDQPIQQAQTSYEVEQDGENDNEEIFLSNDLILLSSTSLIDEDGNPLVQHCRQLVNALADFILSLSFNAAVDVESTELPVDDNIADGAGRSTDPEPENVWPFHVIEVNWDGPKLNQVNGRIKGPSGTETFYNDNLDDVVARMRRLGYTAEEYPYWISPQGYQMLGNYIVVAAHLGLRPRGTIVETSLGMGIVADTWQPNPYSKTLLDLAVIWDD